MAGIEIEFGRRFRGPTNVSELRYKGFCTLRDDILSVESGFKVDITDFWFHTSLC